jgi:hypothetical protein
MDYIPSVFSVLTYTSNWNVSTEYTHTVSTEKATSDPNTTTARRENQAITSDIATARSMEIMHYDQVEFGGYPSAFLR